ncbi:hypothetical protein LOD99_4005 [Oopsacas minuta]|uniref:Uncharacterized protein n=1 Tax=Oopsacas minuta TaxID=111878 RepID=A0AAV7JVZ0_9METZ|nr:hypothetical protein LOD99_4005 [Oopsacas minuta]
MDPLATSLDFDQSFSSLLKVELAKQQNLMDLDDSLSLDHVHAQRLRENNDIPESTTHYIKVYREQLETLQRDNFSLKLQLFYFQKAFESAGQPFIKFHNCILPAISKGLSRSARHCFSHMIF